MTKLEPNYISHW